MVIPHYVFCGIKMISPHCVYGIYMIFPHCVTYGINVIFSHCFIYDIDMVVFHCASCGLFISPLCVFSIGVCIIIDIRINTCISDIFYFIVSLVDAKITIIYNFFIVVDNAVIKGFGKICYTGSMCGHTTVITCYRTCFDAFLTNSACYLEFVFAFGMKRSYCGPWLSFNISCC